MYWASRRTTTRDEDLAYSLLGIFDVNMPMLYGEGGDKAFLRLQEEIIKISDDHSIFAWPLSDDRHCDGSQINQSCHGLLATSPAAFSLCRGFQNAWTRKVRRPYAMTNCGISITLNLTPWCVDTYLAMINCTDKFGGERMGVFLRHLTEDNQYARIALNEGDLIRDADSMQDKVVEDVPIRGRLVGPPSRDLAIYVPQRQLPEGRT